MVNEEDSEDVIFTIEEFESCCKYGELIDYDGFGYYVDNNNVVTDLAVLPSNYHDGTLNKSYKFIKWFNK